MAKVRQIGMAAATFSIALGIGFVMQNGDALASRFGAETAPTQPAPFTQTETVSVAPDPEAAPVAIVTTQGSVLPKAPSFTAAEPVVDAAVILPEAARLPAPLAAPVQLANLDTELAPEMETTIPVAAEVDCVPVMTAQASAVASVALAVTAPCHTDAAFTIHHQGMMFTAMTDANGMAELTVPALAEVSVMIAAFEGGDGAVATAVIPDFSNYDRAVLQWQGETAVRLSAYEGDADYGDDNHIHAGNPGDMARLMDAKGGYLVRLGTTSSGEALMAEIYTFPTGTFGAGPDVMLVAEAEITVLNCGKELNAQSIQVSPDGMTSALDLTMIMPECDAVGDVLILQNMFEDLTLAVR